MGSMAQAYNAVQQTGGPSEISPQRGFLQWLGSGFFFVLLLASLGILAFWLFGFPGQLLAFDFY